MSETVFEYKQSFWRSLKKKFDFIYDIRSTFYFAILLIVISVLFYIVPLINDNFSTLFTGDYTMQYIAMGYNQYDDWTTFFKTGNFVFWDANTFLGADNITSNAYYYLFSPFFIPIILFPRDFVPQAMAILSIVRIVFGGLAFRVYLKKMSASENASRIGASAYAFCGWMAWYLWFNNFLDIIALFPLILLGVEKVLQNKKPWLLAISIFLLAVANFFLLPALTICAFIYAMWRYFHRLKLNNWKDNLIILGVGFAAFAVGLLMGMVVFYPSFIASLGSSRYTSATYLDKLKEFYSSGDFDALMKIVFNWEESDPGYGYRTFYPIINFFIPPMTDRGTPILTSSRGYDMISGSLWMSIPMTMLFIPALIQSLKEKKFTVLIAVLFFIFSIFSPFISYALFGFTTAYLRWSIFLNTSLITYSALYLDKIKSAPKWTLSLGAVFTILGIIAAGLTANKLIIDYDFLTERVDILWTCLIEIIYVVITYFVIRFLYDKKYLYYVFLTMVIVESIAVGAMTCIGHGYFLPEDVSANNGNKINQSLSEVITNINNNDKSYFRTYTSLDNGRSSNNGMINNYNGTQMFHTLYNYNVKEFKYWAGWSDSYTGWSAYYMEKRQNLDAFLGMKYYVVRKSTTTLPGLTPLRVNVPLGASEITELENEDFYVYKMKDSNVSPLGYSYDKIIGYIDDGTNAAASFLDRSNPLNVLISDQMFLTTAIVANEVKDDVIDITDGEISEYIKPSYLDKEFAGFETIISGNVARGGYQKKYYHVPGSAGYDLNKLAEIPDKYEPTIETPTNNNGIFIFIDKVDGTTFDFSEGSAFYINSPYNLNKKVDIFLLDEEGKVITYDRHEDDTYTISRSQGLRGFYSDVPVKSIVVRPRFLYVPTLVVASETGTNFNSRLDAIKPLENVKYVSPNEFSFDTNNNEYRYVVTTIPYEKGWKVVTEDGTRLNTYKSQGGFVGFLAEKGLTSYTMKYMNDDLVTGSIFASVGAGLFIISYAVFIIIEKKRKKRAI
ncbi:MAG: YfhO family protein [Erysipelotrichaceae bacterium]|jgi:uncharacterized membrane protein YfhO|nr:YfhO family protein [Erysipelotrichaceae bacterium]